MPSHLWTCPLTPSTWTIHSTLRQLRRSTALLFLMETHLDDALLAVLRLFGLTNTPQQKKKIPPPASIKLLERRRCRQGFSADAPVTHIHYVLSQRCDSSASSFLFGPLREIPLSCDAQTTPNASVTRSCDSVLP